jgi:hypothetical protein
VRITARKGVLVVLGKGELRREVPLSALVRQVLDEWLEHRKMLQRTGSARCGQPSWRAAVGALGRPRCARGRGEGGAGAVGAYAAAHVPDRVGAARQRSGEGGRARRPSELDTTRRYTLPYAADRPAAVEGLQIDY